MAFEEGVTVALKRTQIYLEPEQHRSLKREARDQGISLAELLRRIVTEHLRKTRSREEFFAIVGLGRGEREDVAERHDHYLGEAVADDEALR